MLLRIRFLLLLGAAKLLGLGWIMMPYWMLKAVHDSEGRKAVAMFLDEQCQCEVCVAKRRKFTGTEVLGRPIR